MDIKLTDSAIRQFLETAVSPEELAEKISLCGPTFDRIQKNGQGYVYDIEVITNRVDSASAQGIARESVAILRQFGQKAVMKNDPYSINNDLYPQLSKTFSFEIDQKIVSRFVAVSLENIHVGKSPLSTENLLSACGERSINNIVDITNEITLLYGMPCHIFDLDKLAVQKLTIRESRAGESVRTLDDQNNKLKGGDIVIEDGAGRLVDLCGIMGGQIAEVDDHTKSILLIVPLYLAGKIRRSSLYLQKRTLASQIYEKQPDSELCLPVLTEAIKLFKERAKASVSSSVFDFNPLPPTQKYVDLDLSWFNHFVGITIPPKTIIAILTNLGFEVTTIDDSHLKCLVPSWRLQDINIKEDLAEEIARVYGYFNLPACLPNINLKPEAKNPVLSAESKIRTFLSNQGFNEIYNSSLISKDLIIKSNLALENHLDLKNALSEDFKYLRLSLVPSILQNIRNNQGKNNEAYLLYEISNCYLKTSEKLPDEHSKLVFTSNQDYRHVKGILELLLSSLNLSDFKFQKSEEPPAYFTDQRTALITSHSKSVGYIGFIKPTVLHSLGISSDPIVVEIDIPQLAQLVSNQYTYTPISEFPEVSESLTLTSKLPVGEIIDKIYQVSPLINNIVYTDSYQDKHTFKISFLSTKNNLTQDKVNVVKKEIISLFN